MPSSRGHRGLWLKVTSLILNSNHFFLIIFHFSQLFMVFRASLLGILGELAGGGSPTPSFPRAPRPLPSRPSIPGPPAPSLPPHFFCGTPPPLDLFDSDPPLPSPPQQKIFNLSIFSQTFLDPRKTIIFLPSPPPNFFSQASNFF